MRKTILKVVQEDGGTQDNQWYWFEGNLGGEGTDV